uniref:Cryptochrome circadian regulator 2 n=1 Tax=Hucho hucho TaxID=62062 RepID=A0A4W5LXZ0_9TELE
MFCRGVKYLFPSLKCKSIYKIFHMRFSGFFLLFCLSLLNVVTVHMVSDCSVFCSPGFKTQGLDPAVWKGGESEALERLNKHLDRKAWVASFERARINMCSLIASPTGLSPYLRFGCLSCRVFYYNLRELYMKLRKHCSPPLSLFGQLLWREFFYAAGTNNPNFDRMEGNPICVQIPWDHNPEALAKWAEGSTGFPWIDAIMTQLRQEGWIHHLARHAVACFLTRGDLWISWESGMRVFEELLLDADWSVNAGSWMWLSCSAFFQQFFHCYCPVGFGKRTDPSGDYIRRYIPKLKDYPNRYIYEPWRAPESVQKAANCIVGVDYPKPMINHAEGSRLNIERMKQVYQQLSHYKGLSEFFFSIANRFAVVCPIEHESRPWFGFFPYSLKGALSRLKPHPGSLTVPAEITAAICPVWVVV